MRRRRRDSDETPQGVHLLRIPTPFAVGAVNAFLIEDEPLTLIDSGPASTRSLATLEEAVAGVGYQLGEIELLAVTHQHVDHLGLTDYIAHAAGAEIACLDALAAYAADFDHSAAADDEFAAKLMRLHGVPDDAIVVLERVATLTRKWGASFTATHTLQQDAVIELRNRSLRLIHAPGHSPTDTLFLDEHNRILFAGDHLLANISSNALISPAPAPNRAPPPHGLNSRQPLIEYLQSLRATRELDLDIVLAGHGPPIHEYRPLIDERLLRADTRAQRILEIITERPRSAYEIAEAIWGRVAVSDAYLTISEVLGHIDLLLADGVVAPSTDPNGAIIYAST